MKSNEKTVEKELNKIKDSKEEGRRRRAERPQSGGTGSNFSKTMMVMTVVGDVEAAYGSSRATGLMDLPSGYRFLPPAVVKLKERNISNATMNMYPGTESSRQDCRNSKYSEPWKADDMHQMPMCEMIALFIIFRLLLSAMWGGLTALVAVAIRMGISQGKGDGS